MTITIDLSTSSINKAIRELTKVKENLAYSLQQTVEMLAEEGAMRARVAYGSMSTAEVDLVSETQAKIVADSGDPDATIIAEFGAGYATMEDHPFAQNAPVPIKVASYSQAQYPYGLFYITNHLMPGEGYWFFGGKEYDRVEPKHGLLDAYDFIMGNSTRIAREVTRL